MATALEHDSVAYGTERDEWQEETARCKSGVCLTVIVFGATGDLAAKKTFKSLATLYNKGCALVSGWTALHSATTATARPCAELFFFCFFFVFVFFVGGLWCTLHDDSAMCAQAKLKERPCTPLTALR